ncbi:hypothetical protein JL720_14682 [Aureococcus anophagefferens]|nr:hypothetical protein JL720_14682 [Aureococcus anophagefferens]
MGRLAACAVVLASRAGGLYLDVPVDGRVLTIEYEASNTYTELWRYAEAFEAEHGLRRFYDQWAKCAPVIYARYKCVTSEILKAMQAHRDAAHALAKDFAYRAMGRWDAFYAAGDDACFAAYCAAHADLADALCGGAACDAPGPLRACREHWEGAAGPRARADHACSAAKETVAVAADGSADVADGSADVAVHEDLFRAFDDPAALTALDFGCARPAERVADRAYTLYHSDGLELDAVPADAYDAVVSFDALSRIPFHATRYRLLEEFFRVLKCDGRASLAMGFGAFHGSVAGYRDDVPVDDGADVQVAFDDPDLLVHDLDRVGFRDMAYWISTGGSGTHAKTLVVAGRKQCPLWNIRVFIGNRSEPETLEELPQAQGTNRKYVDAEIPRKRPTVSGVREELRNMKTTELVKRGARQPETIDSSAGAQGAAEAYTVSVGNLPEPEHDSDDSAYGHSHFHGHESSDSDKED